jgi:hypothetical protein
VDRAATDEEATDEQEEEEEEEEDEETRTREWKGRVLPSRLERVRGAHLCACGPQEQDSDGERRQRFAREVGGRRGVGTP